MSPQLIEELAWIVQGADVAERPAVRAAAAYAIRTAIREALDAAMQGCEDHPGYESRCNCRTVIHDLRDELTGPEPPK